MSDIPNAMSETLIIPAVTLSERYDSNVLLSPKLTGREGEDWVTTVTPRLNILNRGSKALTTLQISGIGERFVNNPGLSYVGGGASLSMNLNRLVQDYAPRLSLTISNSTFYTPQSPTFSPGSIDADPNVFARGIQIVRVNTFSNSAGATATYAFDQATSFRVGYAYSVIRFGHRFVDIGPAALVDTDTQTINAGPQFRVSPQDTLSINYLYQRTDFSGAQLVGLPSRFQTHGGTVGWLRAWSNELRTNVYAGATSVDQGNAEVAAGASTVSQGLLLSYTGGAALAYTDLNPATGGGDGVFGGLGRPGGAGFLGGAGGMGGLGGSGGTSSVGGGGIGILGGASRVVAINYSVGVFPSYFVGGVPVLSHLITASVFRRVGSSWGVTLGGDYAKNQSLSRQAGGQDLQFQSYGGYVSVGFILAPTVLASITGDYHTFEGRGFTLGGAISGGNTDLDRKVVLISLTKIWD